MNVICGKMLDSLMVLVFRITLVCTELESVLDFLFDLYVYIYVLSSLDYFLYKSKITCSKKKGVIFLAGG